MTPEERYKKSNDYINSFPPEFNANALPLLFYESRGFVEAWQSRTRHVDLLTEKLDIAVKALKSISEKHNHLPVSTAKEALDKIVESK